MAALFTIFKSNLRRLPALGLFAVLGVGGCAHVPVYEQIHMAGPFRSFSTSWVEGGGSVVGLTTEPGSVDGDSSGGAGCATCQ